MRHDIVMSWIAKTRPQSILEFGAGEGAFGTRLAQKVECYIGIEPDETSRTTAATRMSSDQILSDTTPIEGQKFDMLCAFEVLEHIEDDRVALVEWLKFCDREDT